jgi:hypothetical protein
MRKLPIDTSTFSELRTSNYLYVDKTQYIYNMITGGRRFFLSRPRRFGKSLLVSTLEEILRAHKQYFDSLWIAQSDYDWKEHGVISLDFSMLLASDLNLFTSSLKKELLRIAKKYQITIDPTLSQADWVLQELVYALFERFGRVALLIDEYDSPILKNLYNETEATKIRDAMQQFLSTIKGLDRYIQFVFITGVSSFAKAGLFSGINNLQILTLRKDYAAICGYTDQEIDSYFSEHLHDWAQQANLSYEELRSQIKSWYNGYHFGENVTAVYNPFSFMNAASNKQFKNFWFQSGTPKFLIEVLKKTQHKFDPEKLTTTEDALGIFDVGHTPLTTLMFQAGYLTIVNYNSNSQLYTLDYPNKEVRVSFQKYLLEIFAHIDPAIAGTLSSELHQAFENQNIAEAVNLLKQLFAHIPYQLHMSQEKYYHSLFMMICIGAGIKAQSEYSTDHARIDLVLEFPKIIYVIEVKFNKTAQEALEQIEAREYYTRFIGEKKPIILLGLNFERKPAFFDITYVVKHLP